MWQGLFSVRSKRFIRDGSKDWKWFDAHEVLWTILILNLIGNALFHWIYRSPALNFIVDRFQTNNTPIYSHGRLYNVAWYKHLFWF